MSDNDLTPDERKAFETLPREMMPSAGLEDRVAGALRSRGLLRPKRRAIVLTRGRVAVAVAASIAFVVAGFALGQWATLHEVTSAQSTLLESHQLSSAASLQYAATAYLLALENLSAAPDSTDGESARQGREVALASLSSAANRVSHFVPRGYLAGQLLQAIEVVEPGSAVPRAGAPADSALIWF
jgi:type IV secretory pathway TrbD component